MIVRAINIVANARIENECWPLQLTSAHLCCWGIRITTACLAVAFKIINTAKLLQLSRITNADGRHSKAPI